MSKAGAFIMGAAVFGLIVATIYHLTHVSDRDWIERGFLVNCMAYVLNDHPVSDDDITPVPAYELSVRPVPLTPPVSNHGTFGSGRFEIVWGALDNANRKERICHVSPRRPDVWNQPQGVFALDPADFVAEMDDLLGQIGLLPDNGYAGGIHQTIGYYPDGEVSYDGLRVVFHLSGDGVHSASVIGPADQ